MATEEPRNQKKLERDTMRVIGTLIVAALCAVHVEGAAQSRQEEYYRGFIREYLEKANLPGVTFQHAKDYIQSRVALAIIQCIKQKERPPQFTVEQQPWTEETRDDWGKFPLDEKSSKTNLKVSIDQTFKNRYKCINCVNVYKHPTGKWVKCYIIHI